VDTWKRSTPSILAQTPVSSTHVLCKHHTICAIGTETSFVCFAGILLYRMFHGSSSLGRFPVFIERSSGARGRQQHEPKSDDFWAKYSIAHLLSPQIKPLTKSFCHAIWSSLSDTLLPEISTNVKGTQLATRHDPQQRSDVNEEEVSLSS